MGMTARTFPAPDAVGGGSYTLDELEALSYDDSDIAAWAGRIYRRERDKALAALSTDSSLPHPVTEDDEYGHERVIGLLYDDGVYTAQGWVGAEGLVASGQALDADTTAFIARAFDEGVDHVYIRPWMPAGWITKSSLTAAGEEPPEGSIPTDGLPEGAIVVAVVDELDKNAVLDLIALAPGPVAFRRHDGEWKEDDTWVRALRSVKPPPLVKIDDPALLVDVVSQIDISTAGQPFSKDEEEKAAVAASGLLAAIEAADARAAIADALVAAKSGKKLANKAAGAERLRQYWLHGKGAAKIRWGTPGDWTRCYRYLSKYMGPRAKGYCQLMHGRATGTWAGRNHRKVPSPAVKAKAIAKQFSR